MFGHKGVKRGWPVFNCATIGDVARDAEPERAIARVKTHTPDLTTSRTQHFGQSMKEWPVRSLKEQKAAV
jgi:hypothetical protein